LDRRVRRRPLQGFRISSRLFRSHVAVPRTTLSGFCCLSKRSDRRSGVIGSPLPPRRFPRPRGVPSIGRPHGPRTVRRLPQASPPSQGSGRDVLTGPAGPDRPSWGFTPLQRHRPERSVGRGVTSPATVRPRSFSLPRRLALLPVSRTRWVRCRSWGFGSSVLSSAEAVTRRRVRCVVPTPARAVLAPLRTRGRSLPSP
jgi:hypothetical protein